MALAIALCELLGGESSEVVRPHEGGASCLDLQVVSPQSGSTSGGQTLLVLVCIAVAIGMLVGWKSAMWWCGGAPSPTKAVVADATVRPRWAEKSTQSQVRYTWASTVPRFVPLQDFAHGCWESGWGPNGPRVEPQMGTADGVEPRGGAAPNSGAAAGTASPSTPSSPRAERPRARGCVAD